MTFVSNPRVLPSPRWAKLKSKNFLGPTEAKLRFLVKSISVTVKKLNYSMFSCLNYEGIFTPDVLDPQSLDKNMICTCTLLRDVKELNR